MILRSNGNICSEHLIMSIFKEIEKWEFNGTFEQIIGDKENDTQEGGQNIIWHFSSYIYTILKERINARQIFEFLRNFVDRELQIVDSDQLFQLKVDQRYSQEQKFHWDF
jgi:hypothetical protein